MSNFTCPNDDCGQEITPKETRPGLGTPEADSIILCGSCGEIAVVQADGSCRTMGQVEFLLLDKDSQHDLDFARRAILAHIHRN